MTPLYLFIYEYIYTVTRMTCITIVIKDCLVGKLICIYYPVHSNILSFINDIFRKSMSLIEFFVFIIYLRVMWYVSRVRTKHNIRIHHKLKLYLPLKQCYSYESTIYTFIGDIGYSLINDTRTRYHLSRTHPSTVGEMDRHRHTRCRASNRL